ncbi:hypothetical protein GDO78_014923 [Eleutherodactylus coqui]|uniref:Uncharacterized protein n=1 Tax=Eleutherodactylus coqui TaxID=57060 RepID=A0A8J6JKB8_ELECQ|nr:hypothetical protein GDO78_014923 [Eleutherodactylus coqui]
MTNGLCLRNSELHLERKKLGKIGAPRCQVPSLRESTKTAVFLVVCEPLCHAWADYGVSVLTRVFLPLFISEQTQGCSEQNSPIVKWVHPPFAGLKHRMEKGNTRLPHFLVEEKDSMT